MSDYDYELADDEKQAEAQSWKHWQEEAWGNTESGAHVHGWIAGRDWALKSLKDRESEHE